MLRSYLLKLIRSKSFYAAIILAAVLCAAEPVKDFFGTGFNFFNDVIFTSNSIFSHMDFCLVISIMGAVPFAANFADEWKNGAITYYVTRCGVKKYAAVNVTVCAASSIITVTAGMMIFVFAFHFVAWPLDECDISSWFGRPYGAIAAAGFPYLYILARTIVFAAGNSVAAVFGMTFSAFIPDKYVAICTPLIFMTTIQTFATMNPDLFNLIFPYLMKSWVPMFGNPLLELLYTLAYFAVFIVIFGVIFMKAVERRVRCANG